MDHLVFICSLVDGHVGRSHLLAAVDVGVQESESLLSVPLGTGGGIAGSRCILYFTFQGTVSHSSCTFSRSHQ